MPATPTRIGRYEVLGLIGAGGMGEVLRARDERLGRDVALKRLPESHKLDPERKARFEREARLLAALSHPNIAMLHGIEEIGDSQVLVLELVEGRTLGERLQGAPLLPAEALAIARQIAAALEAAHERGIVHRDLKPSNLKIRPDGTVKLLDFGLAKVFAPDAADVKGVDVAATMLDLGAGPAPVIGTPAYMSPEQARGEAVDRRTDIWAFGCVLYEMLVGRAAFSGDCTADILARVLEREPDFDALPADTAPAVRRLLRRCLEKDPSQRLRDIGDARPELDGRGEPHARTTPSPKQWRAARRSRPWAAAGAAALVVLAAAWATEQLRRVSPREHREFVLVPPAGISLAARTPPFAVSPDGRRIVFAASDAAGRRALWVQELDSIEARRLPDTDGASDPFWSPDGQAIGFFASASLKTLSLAEGAPRVVTPLPAAVTVAGGATAGATWSRSGIIVFAPSPKSRLYSVDAAGGEPVPVTELQPGDVGHVRPQFLPDDRHIQYLVTAETPSRRGIHVASIDSFDARLVLPTVVKAVYASPGYLLFVREGELRARAFDASALDWAASEELVVADSVDHLTTEGRASFDASANGILVYRESGLLPASQPIIVDQQGTTLARVGAPGDYQTLALSHDGTQLAVEQHDLQTATGDLWLFDVNSGLTRRLTSDGLHHNAAVWSPTDAELVVTGRPGGVRNLHLMDVRSGAHEPLLPSGPDRNPTDWSPDGRYILYEENAPGTSYDLWALEMPERKPLPLVRESFNERSARVSPDGRFMAYVSDRTGTSEVYVRPFLDPHAGNEKKVSVTGGFAPRWSANGSQLFYYGLDKAVIAVDVQLGDTFRAARPSQLFAVDMRFTCSREAGLRCPSPPVTWEVLSGERFLINASPTGPPPTTPPIRVIETWTSLLPAPTALRP